MIRRRRADPDADRRGSEGRPATLAGLALVVALATPVAGIAQAGGIFKDADLALGQKLITEHRCDACHIRRVGGDGSAIYRPQGRINTPGLLRGMVEYCNTDLGLALFPDEVTAIAAVLNRDHYRFRD